MVVPVVKTQTIDHVDLPPKRREIITEVTVPDRVLEHIVDVPETAHIERVEEVQVPVVSKRLVPFPKYRVEERLVKVIKPVIKEQIVEIPEIEWVEKVVEVPQYIYRERRIEVVRPVVHERIIPIDPPVIYERTKDPPVVVTTQGPVIEERIQKMPPTSIVQEKQWHPAFPVPVTNYHRPSPFVGYQPGAPVYPIPGRRPIAYREIPHLINYPVPYYRPVPTEHIYKKKIPVPVQLEVDQEIEQPYFQCRYFNVPVNMYPQ